MEVDGAGLGLHEPEPRGRHPLDHIGQAGQAVASRFGTQGPPPRQGVAGRPGRVRRLTRGCFGSLPHHGAVVGVDDGVGPRARVDPLPADQELPGPVHINGCVFAGVRTVVRHPASLLSPDSPTIGPDPGQRTAPPPSNLAR